MLTLKALVFKTDFSDTSLYFVLSTQSRAKWWCRVPWGGRDSRIRNSRPTQASFQVRIQPDLYELQSENKHYRMQHSLSGFYNRMEDGGEGNWKEQKRI